MTEETDHGEVVRRQAVELLDALTAKVAEFELPQPPESFGAYREELVEGSYKVLVVGEAKRGKSTFVNALIGREILPTDIDVATSQVFHVTPAPQPAFRLRFEDDTAREITQQDLSRYGSQVVADAEGVPQLSEMIRWIEVEGPITFLPKGVSILDTPGLGALYAAHAQITHRFVRLADAVVFVLDSGQPVVQEELDFVESILDVTEDLFFIQTKIDLYGRDHWQEIKRRNEEILAARFGDRLGAPRVWPISSTNLRKAADPDNKDAEMHLLVSRHRELAAALRAFLFRVAGWRRTTEFLLVAERFHAVARQPFAARLKALTEESRQKRLERREAADEMRRDFEADWGERGQKRQQLAEDIRKVINVARQTFRQALTAGDEIESAQTAAIDALASIDDVQQRGELIAAEVSSAAAARWDRVCRDAQLRCAELLAPFIEASDALIALEDGGGGPVVIRDKAMLDLEDVLWRKIKYARTEGLAASGIAGVVFGIPALFFPLLGIPIILAGLWGTKKGWKDAAKRELDTAKQKLRAHLAQVMQQVRKHYFDVDLSSGRLSRVDEYFDALENGLLEQVRALSRQKSAEAKAELARLEELGEMDEKGRAEQIGQVKRQLAEWGRLGGEVKSLAARLKQLEREYAASAASSAGE